VDAEEDEVLKEERKEGEDAARFFSFSAFLVLEPCMLLATSFFFRSAFSMFCGRRSLYPVNIASPSWARVVSALCASHHRQHYTIDGSVRFHVPLFLSDGSVRFHVPLFLSFRRLCQISRSSLSFFRT
jgi:hypothetical protein